MDLIDRKGQQARLVFIMMLLLFCFLLISTIFSYQRQRALMHKMARVEARIVAGEVLEAMGEVKALPRGATGKGAVVHRQPEELQRLVNRITAPDKFRVEILPFDPEKKGLRLDKNELKLLHRLEKDKSEEEFLFLSLKGEWGLLYMRPVRAGKECLGCHRSFDSAPDSVRALYSRQSGIFGHGETDMMGSVVVFMPMKEMYDTVRGNVLSALFIMLLPILLFVVTLSFRRRKQDSR